MSSAAVMFNAVSARPSSTANVAPAGNGPTRAVPRRGMKCLNAVPQKVNAGEEKSKIVNSLEQNLALANLSEADLTPEMKYAMKRNKTIQDHFPGSLSVDDFLFRVEMALSAFGFDGENSIALVNLCRDEATNVFRNKIEEIYPLMFNITGLGGGVTCGVTGLKAGLSHAPESPSGKKRYIFFACPHIGIDSNGGIGNIARPGQSKISCACGAMAGALGQFKADGLEAFVEKPGVHTPLDPEFSILKQSLARRIMQESKKVDELDLVELTKIGDRTITAELERLVQKAVNPEEADYAIITGVQIHNTGMEFDNDEPNLEFIAPNTVSVIINGERVDLDLSYLPAASPRQVGVLGGMALSNSPQSMVANTGNATVSSIGGPGRTALPNSGIAPRGRDATFQRLLEACE
mmetsp:Transcript_22805/g.54572  ORF Transcript_22805/g.54572 Transcript_22805/m.54572 type:complete len:407 (-) Transcript_22805:175-1395(-)